MKEDIRDYLPDRDLSIGEQIKVHHCTSGKDNDRLYIKRTENGYIFFCHHCGWNGGSYESDSNYSKVKKRLSKHTTESSVCNTYVSKKPKLPFDSDRRVRDWPSKAKVWVYKAGITDGELDKYGFAYSPYYDRVWYPVYNNNVISCVIGRSLDEKNDPKYLMYKDKDFNDLWYSNPTESSKVCIVEDVLSGIRCSRFVAGAALLGTNFTDSTIQYLIHRHQEFIIFLDDDKPQVKMKQVKLKRMLELFGPVKLITKIGKDPKNLTDKELKELLL